MISYFLLLSNNTIFYLNAKDINTIVKAFKITNAKINTVFECIALGFIKIKTV